MLNITKQPKKYANAESQKRNAFAIKRKEVLLSQLPQQKEVLMSKEKLILLQK